MASRTPSRRRPPPSPAAWPPSRTSRPAPPTRSARSPKAGWVNSDPGGTARFCKTSATLVSGATPTQLKFGNYQPVDLTVLKYHDLDASGGQNGSEAGLSGWGLLTSDADNDGVQDALETPTAARTIAGGVATFQDLTPRRLGDKICEVTQAGWVNSDPGGTAPFCKTSATLVSGVTPTQLKFGNYQPVDLTVLKYHDLDASGGQNGSEAGLSGWVFWIDADNDGVQDALETTATTIAGGVATFQDLTPGASYKICEVTQAGWVNSDPGGTAPFCKTSATLVSGVTPTQLKFGNYQPVDLTVLKYHDLDASGGQNGSEAGLSGWVF